MPDSKNLNLKNIEAYLQLSMHYDPDKDYVKVLAEREKAKKAADKKTK